MNTTTETTMAKRINVTTTAYEGDVAFPEADSYPEYVTEQLAERYGAEVDCSVGGRTQVSLYGFDDADRDLEHEIASLVKVDLWDEFCAEGYKAYTPTTAIVKAAEDAASAYLQEFGPAAAWDDSWFTEAFEIDSAGKGWQWVDYRDAAKAAHKRRSHPYSDSYSLITLR